MKEVDQLEKLEEQGPLNQEQRKTLGNYKALLQEIYKRGDHVVSESKNQVVEGARCKHCFLPQDGKYAKET